MTDPNGEGGMNQNPRKTRNAVPPLTPPRDDGGLQVLVESALRRVASKTRQPRPETRADWIDRICVRLMEESDAGAQALVPDLIANGFGAEEIYQSLIPDAARRLGDMWLRDEAGFVDVTVAASRLQALLREAGEGAGNTAPGQAIPMGQAVLMVVPDFEGHTLGAFVAADQFRRHGIWVHMAIGLKPQEVAEMVAGGRFSMVAVTVSMAKSLEKLAHLIQVIRDGTAQCPPVVLGGSVVTEVAGIERRTGADHAAKSVREAIERSGLVSVAETLLVDSSFGG